MYFRPTTSSKHAASKGPSIPPKANTDVITEASISVTSRKNSDDIISGNDGDDHPTQLPMPMNGRFTETKITFSFEKVLYQLDGISG